MITRGVHILMFLSASVVIIAGFEPRGKLEGRMPTLEDCARPPMKRIGRECCKPPKEKIWGDLKGSLNMCMSKVKLEPGREPEFSRQESGEGGPEEMAPEGSEMGTSTEEQSDSAPAPSSGPPSTTEGFPNRRRRPPWKKPHHFHRRANDSCFMECVFEDQGFLVNKMLNKDALLARLKTTLAANEPWHTAAVAALETCYSGLQVPPNGSCHSGSEEIFRCTFKQLFLNCPNWVQSDYCSSLKEFYQKCPEGPPPEPMDSHVTPAPEEDAESAGTTES